ncbi:MAG: F0F1 ATP synthase subunit B [Armatimonadetes bacterium]|nr:F0F1 ATP synthase subunit B [Armatimonadota bacterium]
MEMSFNVPTLVIQIANFLILWIALDMVLYKPMLGAIAERQEKIKKAIDEAEAVNREALSLKEQYDAKLKEARQEAASIVNAAAVEGQALKSQLVAEGNEDKQRIIEKGHSEVSRERQEALSEVKGRVVNLSVDLASQLFKDALGPDQHRALVSEFARKASQIHAG